MIDVCLQYGPREEFKGWGGEDDDFLLRVRESGRSLCVIDAPRFLQLPHIGSKAFNPWGVYDNNANLLKARHP